jgi:hypothetical protein
VVGTGVHTWQGSSEALASKALSELYPKIDTRAVYHSLITLKHQRGQRIDLAHHGPHPGTRKHLKGSIARHHLVSMMNAELIDQHIPPQVYVRAHYHEYLHVGPARVRSQGRDIESRLIICPCYTGATPYTRKATRSIDHLDHGLVALEFEDGLREVHPYYEELDIRTKEEL